MDELEKLRQQKIQEIQNQYSDQHSQQQEAEQQIQALEHIVKSKLTKKAVERYGNLKTAHPQKAIQLLLVLARSGQSEINDDQLKSILKKMGSKRDIKITRK